MSQIGIEDQYGGRMLIRTRSVFLKSSAALVLFALSSALFAERLPLPWADAADEAQGVSSMELPEAPTPHIAIDADQQQTPQTPATPDKDTSQPASPQSQSPAATGSDSSQSASPAPADDQIKKQEHQRVMGIIPAFNTSYDNNAASLTPKQKLNLAFHSVIDPYTFGIAFIVAGIGEAEDDDVEQGWGPEGYFKRSGAAYLDSFDGTMIGNAFLPILLHQDPRYFRLGHGTAKHRLFYAIATSYICKHDNTGKWEPNYSNVGGNIIAGAISNLYYPSQGSGWGQTLSHGFIVTSEGTFGGVLQEFWPDISRKLFHKDPTDGHDAQMRAADAAAKQAKADAKKASQSQP
jgi:hypothetical protein